MVYSPQDVYARHLVSGRGYPLWTPEPDMNLPEIYLREGLKIGDVGVVVPENGSFDVFFNVCLPPTHALHRETGVPDNFNPISLGERDISKYPEAEDAGQVILATSVTRVRGTDVSDEDSTRRTQPGPLNYEFVLSSREGAILILPEGAEHYHLRNERLFLDEAIQHAVDWYAFAEQRLGRIISHDSLYLITGFYKASSWSLAAYQHGHDTNPREASAQFKAVQVGGGNIATRYTWETTQAMDWRVGPSDRYYSGIPNQTVFIRGFKIAIREGILGRKRINVKVDVPSVRPHRFEFSNGSWLSSLWSRMSGGGSRSTAISPKGTGTTLNTDTTGSNPPAHEDDDALRDVAIHRFPPVMKPFHPSDSINQYLLRKVPSAIVAITHDSHWVTLLDKGLLKPEELSQEDRLISSVVRNYSMALSHEGTVYLQSTAARNDTDATSPAPSLPDVNVNPALETSLFRTSPHSNHAEVCPIDPLGVLESNQANEQTNQAEAANLGPRDCEPEDSTKSNSTTITHCTFPSGPPASPSPLPSPLDYDKGKQIEVQKEDSTAVKDACVQCKSSKIRCEFGNYGNTCKRCLNAGRECVTSDHTDGHSTLKREHLLNQLRDQAKQIQELMQRVESSTRPAPDQPSHPPELSIHSPKESKLSLNSLDANINHALDASSRSACARDSSVVYNHSSLSALESSLANYQASPSWRNLEPDQSTPGESLNSNYEQATISTHDLYLSAGSQQSTPPFLLSPQQSEPHVQHFDLWYNTQHYGVKRPRLLDDCQDGKGEHLDVPERRTARLMGACSRCKKLKVRCETRPNNDYCKRCMASGTKCTIPGRKLRSVADTRKRLLDQIREQIQRIQELLADIEALKRPAEISPPSGPSIHSPTESNPHVVPNPTTHDWIAKARALIHEFEGLISGELADAADSDNGSATEEQSDDETVCASGSNHTSPNTSSPADSTQKKEATRKASKAGGREIFIPGSTQ